MTHSPGAPKSVLDTLALRPYADGDEAAILESFNRVFREVCGPAFVDRDLAYWRWLFGANPLGRRIQLAVADEGTVAGQWAGVPFRALTAQGPAQFVHVVDNFVHPDFRKGGQGGPGVFAFVGETGTQDWFSRGDALLYGYPVALGERMGRRFLKNRRLRVLSYLCRALADVPSASSNEVVVETVKELGPEADALFDALAKRESFLLVRDAAYLRWRYLDCPGEVYRVLTARRAGELVGIAALRPSHDILPGACTVADWVVPAQDRVVVDALLGRAAEIGREAGRRMLLAVFAEPSPEFGLFTAAGFELVPSSQTFERPLTYRVHPERTDITEELMRETWWYTLGDSDLV